MMNDDDEVMEESILAAGATIEEPKEKPKEKKVVDIKSVECSSKDTDAAYDSKSGELVITKNGITIAIYQCVSRDHAKMVASKF